MYEILHVVIQVSKNTKRGEELVGYVENMDKYLEGKIKISKSKEDALKFPMYEDIYQKLRQLSMICFNDNYIFKEAYFIETKDLSKAKTKLFK